FSPAQVCWFIQCDEERGQIIWKADADDDADTPMSAKPRRVRADTRADRRREKDRLRKRQARARKRQFKVYTNETPPDASAYSSADSAGAVLRTRLRTRWRTTDNADTAD